MKIIDAVSQVNGEDVMNRVGIVKLFHGQYLVKKGLREEEKKEKKGKKGGKKDKKEKKGKYRLIIPVRLDFHREFICPI